MTGSQGCFWLHLEAGPTLPSGSLARSCRHRISLLRLLLWAPMGDGLLGWESSCPRRLPGGSRLRGVPPRAAPSEPLRSLSAPAGRGRGRDPGWHPRGGGLFSPGSACGRAPVGSPWAFSPPWSSQLDPSRSSILAPGSCALPGFSRQKIPVFKFLPACHDHSKVLLF